MSEMQTTLDFNALSGLQEWGKQSSPIPIDVRVSSPDEPELDHNYDLLLTLLESLVEDHNRQSLLDFCDKHRDRMYTTPAARHNHHNYPGGFLVHTVQVMTIAVKLYRQFQGFIKSEFTYDDLIISAFAHDISKFHMYRQADTGSGFEHTDFRFQPDVKSISMLTEHGVRLNYQVITAVMTAEGGWSQLTFPAPTRLGSIVHCADMLSSQVIKEQFCS